MSRKKLVLPATRFKRNSLALLAIFHDFFDGLDEEEKIDMKNFNLAYTYVDNSEGEVLLLSFVVNTSPHWPNLLGRNNEYLVENIMNFTSDRYRKKLKPYFDLARNEKGLLRLKKDNVSLAWDYVHNMVKCCIHYLHDNRDKRAVISNPNLNSHDAEALARVWKVDLGKQIYETESEDEGSDESSDSD